MDKKDVWDITQIVGGSYIAYQGINHGLPRALGIRIENHITTKENALLIKKSGNILKPEYGGKAGFASRIKSKKLMKNSQNFVHISGVNKISENFYKLPFSKLVKKYKFLEKSQKTIYRKLQKFMYKNVGNDNYLELQKFLRKGKKFKFILGNIKAFFLIKLHDNTKSFYIPGIDSYFDKQFIPDSDDIALKSTKRLKAYSNRFTAMTAGLKKFGLKGMKENKSRVTFGLALLSLGLYTGLNLINKGIKNIKNLGLI